MGWVSVLRVFVLEFFCLVQWFQCKLRWFQCKLRRNMDCNLFIDASKLGSKVDKRRVELSDEAIERIGATVAAWRSGTGYADVAGYCQSATLEDIARQDYVLTPARYVASDG